jgi:hypothetical protein
VYLCTVLHEPGGATYQRNAPLPLSVSGGCVVLVFCFGCSPRPFFSLQVVHDPREDYLGTPLSPWEEGKSAAKSSKAKSHH